MIEATCPSCGASFKAKDEYAGKRVKCPRCKEPFAFPEASTAQAPRAPAKAAPAAPTRKPAPVAPKAPARATAPTAPAAAAGRATGAAPATRGSEGAAAAAGAPASRRSPARGGARAGRAHGGHAHADDHGGPPRWLLPALGGVIVLGVIALWIMHNQGPDTVRIYQQGIDAFQKGDYDTAIAAFESIPASDALAPGAREKLALAREQKALREQMGSAREAEVLYAKMLAVKQNYVEKNGPGYIDYAPDTRFLLILGKEFLEKFPGDPHAAEVQDWFRFYAKVASLDKPPTARDAWVEARWRAEALDYVEAVAVLDRYEALPDHDKEGLAQARKDLHAMAEVQWKGEKAKLERSGSFQVGNENWVRIRNATNRFLEATTPFPELAAEAREWNDKANAALQAGG